MKLFELKSRQIVPAGMIKTVVIHAANEKQARITAKKETGEVRWQDNKATECYEIGDFRCVVEKVTQG